MYRPFLLSLTTLLHASLAHATSVGKVERGALENAMRLPAEGEHHYILPQRHRARGIHYGTVALVELVLDAARTVAARHPGSKLAAGNLSRKAGGPIPYSRSHQSGRDADLAFFMTDAQGRPHTPRDFVKFDRSGVSRSRLRFDVRRNWTLVEALLGSTKAQVQWLLIHRSLKSLLLRHARAIGANPEIVRRAERVLHHPRRVLPHDDHLHVRIYCPPDDLARGCEDTGPVWPWAARPVSADLPRGMR
jgi:penicillin-insensitive murein endopeptidase